MTSVVVDTCIARSAGGVGATHPGACIARDFLDAVRLAKRPLAYGPEIKAEWEKHRSRYAQQWLASMYARKLVDDTVPKKQAGLRNKVKTCGCAPGERLLMEKDFHLLDECYKSGGPVASTDDAARGCFARYYDGLGIRKGIHWVNPNEEHGNNFAWIKAETVGATTRLLSDYQSA